MTDIARVGFSADTKALDDAKAKLDALVPAAKRVDAATKNVNAGFGVTATAFGKAAAGATTVNSALNSAASGANNASGAVNNAANAANNGASIFARFRAILSSFVPQLNAVQPAAAGAQSSLNRLGAAANDNINRLQSTPGNIAAQFQDIGVTAAGGMNPLIIGLQQGTQLSAAFAGGLGNVVEGLKQVFSATTILTVGIVAGLAALIQWVDWIGVAQAALNGLADILPTIAPYLLGISAALALIYAPAVIGGIIALTKAFVGLAASMVLTLGIPAMIVLGFAAIVAAANIWRDDLTRMLGFDIVAAAKTGVNAIIAFFVGGYNAIRATWSQLPAAIGDVAIQAANATLRAIDDMVLGTINKLKALFLFLPGGQMALGGLGGLVAGSRTQIANPYAGSASKVGQAWGRETQASLDVDYVGKSLEYVGDVASDAADALRDLAAGLGGDEAGKGGKKARAARARQARTPRPEKTIDEKFFDIIDDAGKQMRALQQAGKQIGVYGYELAKMKYQQELFNAAQDKGIPLIDAATGGLTKYGEELRKISIELAKQDEMNRQNQFIEEHNKGVDRRRRELEAERAEIGLTGEALRAHRLEQELLNKAIEAHIPLDEARRASIRQAAVEYAAAAEQIHRLRENLEFARETTKGFFQDWFNKTREGTNVFKAFGESVLNMLNRIVDRLFNGLLDSLVNNLFPAPSQAGGGGGLLGNLLGNITSIFGGGIGGGTSMGGGGRGVSSALSTIATAPMGRFAAGAAFGAGGALLTTPTMFKYARGAGVAGEKGPEAVMPLHRGSDGSLGVRMAGGGASSGPPVFNVHVSNDNRVTGAVSSQDIIELQRRSAEQTKHELSRQIPELLQRYQRDGAMV